MTAPSAWTALLSELASAANPVEVLPAQRDGGAKAQRALQLDSSSTLGALALHCGGILVDGGWLRILGSGHPRLPGSLLDWNGLAGNSRPAIVGGALVVGHDLVGGLFAVNGGGLPGAEGQVCYFSPLSRRWESLDAGHTAWVDWALNGDLAGFYNPLRWPDWEDEAEGLGGDQGVHLWPPPWSGPAWRPDDAQRQVVAMDELVQRIFTGRPPTPEPTN